MKSLPFLFGCICLLFACKNNDSDCGKNITLIQPDANPANYEIIIRPDGFSQQAKVLFGQEQAITRAGNNGDIIARVPAGLRGNVELSLEEGDCIARQDFTVLDSLPGTYGQSLPNITLPSPPASFPSNLSNFYQNAADLNHHFILSQSGNSLTFDPSSTEGHDSNPDLGFGHSNLVSGSWDTLQNTMHLVVDRSPSGGTTEEFDGVFIKTFPGAPSTDIANTFILLTSRKTGRQMIIMTFFG